MTQPTFVIEFKGFKTLDTLQEVKDFVGSIGSDRVIEIRHCVYPDGIEFYTIHYKTMEGDQK